MTTMTKDEAEKAAKEFAWEKINEGLVVWRTDNHNEIRINNQNTHKSFPFIDLVPGDACLVRGIDQKWVIKMFSRLRESGRPLFVSKIENIGNMTWGVTYDNYRKLGFNVLEIEEG